MPNLVGPSHHVFFAALHRKTIWLDHLVDAFEKLADPAWPAAHHQLRSNFVRTFARLASQEGLGIRKPLRLTDVLDDTPVDSFLSNLAEELNAYQSNLFEQITQHAMDGNWVDTLAEVSMLWGRELAQECLMSPAHRQIVRDANSVRGIFEAFFNVIEGGDFAWKPFLIRRYTDVELQYELRQCPHRKTVMRSTADLACQLEARVYAGFAEALLPGSSFARAQRNSYCLDELHIQREKPRDFPL